MFDTTENGPAAASRVGTFKHFLLANTDLTLCQLDCVLTSRGWLRATAALAILHQLVGIPGLVRSSVPSPAVRHRGVPSLGCSCVSLASRPVTIPPIHDTVVEDSEAIEVLDGVITDRDIL